MELTQNETDDNFPKSGNPGYIQGSPVMAGLAITNDTREAVLLLKDNSKWLTVITSDAAGICRSDLRQPVLFGLNSHSGCFLM